MKTIILAALFATTLQVHAKDFDNPFDWCGTPPKPPRPTVPPLSQSDAALEKLLAAGIKPKSVELMAGTVKKPLMLCDGRTCDTKPPVFDLKRGRAHSARSAGPRTDLRATLLKR